MADWHDEPCQVCGRKVMDELACPDRISNGDVMCVDCCGYLSVDPDDSDMHCPIEHSEFYYPEEWLMEIYSAYSDLDRFPDDESVLDILPNSVRQTIEDAGGPVAYLERRYGRRLPSPRRPAIPDPFRCAINRRAV
jgi:hypothetical protein